MIKIKGAACLILILLLLVLIDTQKTNAKNFEIIKSSSSINKINGKDIIKKIFYGEWLVSDYVETVALQDLNPLPEDYNSSPDKEFKNLKIVFDDSTVINFSGPSELGFVYDDTEDLFLAYQVPLILKGPIIYVCIQHIDFDNEISFIRDSEKNTYIEINYNYYKLKKLSG